MLLNIAQHVLSLAAQPTARAVAKDIGGGQPFNLDGHCMHTSASIGIAPYPHDGTDARTLLKSADVAMYKAKRSGRNRFEFHSHGHETPIAAG